MPAQNAVRILRMMASETPSLTVYPTALGVQFYSDDWRDSHRTDARYHWREDQKDDHGYYEGSEWHVFAPDHN